MNSAAHIPRKHLQHHQLKWMKYAEEKDFKGVADVEEQSDEEEVYDTETKFLTK